MEAYLDNSATTRCSDRACQLMVDLLTKDYGNPSSLHMKGIEAERFVETAKKKIAKTLRVSEKEIIFTSGGTESNNLAIIGAAMANRRAGNHIITTSIEHASVENPMEFLKEQGFDITYLSVDENGIISLEELEEAVTEQTILVSMMQVNNEIGAIEPVAEAAELIKKKNPDTLIHVDAIQSYGKMYIYPKKLGIDMLSVSGHKIHGPKGSGFLWVKEKTKLKPLILGGGQQKGMRSGTENVPAIAGFGVAAKIAFNQMRSTMRHEIALRNYLIQRVLHEIPFCQLNGSHQNRLPGNANFSFEYVEGSSLLMMLDAQGICASSGSACASSSAEPSHVLTAIGLSDELAHASLRLTLGRNTTKKELDLVVSILKETIDQLRSISDSYLNRISR